MKSLTLALALSMFTVSLAVSCDDAPAANDCPCAPGETCSEDACTLACSTADCPDICAGDTCQTSPDTECAVGYTNRGMGCVDDDECAGEGSGNDCDPNSVCTNTDGGFTCTCEAGYADDGQGCLDIDECALGTHDCSAAQVCRNDEGTGWTCLDCDEITLTTTSTSATWPAGEIVNNGATLTWQVSGGVSIAEVTSDAPELDLSANTGEAVVTIKSADSFDGVATLELDNAGITSITNLACLDQATTFGLRINPIESIDVSGLASIDILTLRTLPLAELDLGALATLRMLWAYGNELTTLDLSHNPNLEYVKVTDNQLTSAALDQLLFDLDGHGKRDGQLLIAGNTGSLTSAAYDAYYSLLDKNWTIDVAPPVQASAPAGVHPKLIASQTTSASTIEMVFDAAVDGTPAGFSVYGTRSVAFTDVSGFGTSTLVGTLADGVVYGEVVTVSYDDAIGDLAGSSGDVLWFRRELVTNHEPYLGGASGGGKDIYVTATADGSGDGSAARPYTMAQINSATNVAVGDRINIKKGVYTTALTASRSGSSGNPIIYEGYDTVPGDLDYDAFHPIYPDALSGDHMPLFDGGNRETAGRAVTISGKHHVVFMNLQLTNWGTGMSTAFATASHDVSVINCATAYVGTKNGSGIALVSSTAGPQPYNMSVVDSYARNSSMANISVGGMDGFIYNSRSYSDENLTVDLGTDYLFGTKNLHNGVVRKSHAEIVGDLPHTGHGFSVRSDWGYTAHNVLIDDCDVVNVNGAIEFRHDEVKYGLARNVRITGGNSRYEGGIHFRDGASFNTVDGCYVRDISDSDGRNPNGAVAFYDTSEEGYGQVIEGNIVRNTVFENIDLLMRIGVGALDPFTVRGTRFANCTLSNVEGVFQLGSTVTSEDNTIQNTIFNQVATDLYTGGGSSSSPISGWDGSYNDHFGGFAMPTGTGNVSIDPLFEQGGDFHLQEGSPVKDAGTDLAFVERDFDGVDRVSGKLSIGAFERD